MHAGWITVMCLVCHRNQHWMCWWVGEVLDEYYCCVKNFIILIDSCRLSGIAISGLSLFSWTECEEKIAVYPMK